MIWEIILHEYITACPIIGKSTYNGTKKYHVGESGLPVSDDPVYTVDAGFLLKTKADIPCKIKDWKADKEILFKDVGEDN